MKRDLNLVRELLRQIESWSDMSSYQTLEVDGVSDDVIQYHLLLMHEAELIRGAVADYADSPCVIPDRLTWQGHEYLDAARDDAVWKKVMKTAGQVPLEVSKALLVAELKSRLGIGGSSS